MHRRQFLGTVAALPAALPLAL
ncbi:MAG: twin-arginine translocation signal domain-containing protein, partial [Vicinamibacterales bacterium]